MIKNTIDQRIRDRLLNIIIAGCTCSTKTPNLECHKDNCHYRNAEEIWSLLLTGKLPNDNESTKDNNSSNG